MTRSLVILIAVGLFAGCRDADADRRHKAMEDLQHAIELARAADQGFIPVSGVQGDSQLRLQAYRNASIGEVTKALEALSRDVPDAQSGPVKQLLSGYHSSNARYQAREAANQWTELTGRISHLLAHMMAIDRIDRRALILESDETPMLETVGDELDKRDGKRQFLEKSVARQGASISELDKKISELDREKQLILLDAAELRRQAFVEKGQQNLDMQRQAAEVQTEAMKLEKQMQELSLDRDKIQDTYRTDREQLALYAESTEWLEQVIGQAQTRQEASQAAHQEALEQKASQSDRMYQQFEQIHARFNEQVDGRFVEAAEVADRAVSVLSGTRGAHLERLAAHMSQLHVLSQHIMIMTTYGESLKLIAVRADRLVPERAGSFHVTVQDVRKKRDELVAKADVINADANELVEAVSDEDGLSEYRNYLANYHQRIHGAARELESQL